MASEAPIHVLIVGGGVSGIAAAVNLQKELESRTDGGIFAAVSRLVGGRASAPASLRKRMTYTVVEAESRIGGTWESNS
jgi:cation diffusion facilitator CzcD-associated flavoprotein CzcO